MSDIKDNNYWKDKLDEKTFEITRLKGTEPAFSGVYYNNSDQGRYLCKCCKTELFDSSKKYDSGSGWPSFFEPVNSDIITYQEDYSHGMQRIEITCSNCDSHLGHVFDDGPKPSGKRYCVNSLSLDFEGDEK